MSSRFEVEIYSEWCTSTEQSQPLPNNMTTFVSNTPFVVRKNDTNASTSCRRATVCASASAGLSRRAFGALLSSGVLSTLAPFPALADKTAQSQRRAYERYYPRILAGGVRLREIGQSLSKGDIAEANAAVSSKEFDVKFRRALSIYATSFSDSVLSQQSQDLLYVTNRLFDELNSFKNATSVTDDVMEKYNTATEAYRKYNKIARLPKDMVAGM